MYSHVKQIMQLKTDTSELGVKKLKSLNLPISNWLILKTKSEE